MLYKQTGQAGFTSHTNDVLSICRWPAKRTLLIEALHCLNQRLVRLCFLPGLPPRCMTSLSPRGRYADGMCLQCRTQTDTFTLQCEWLLGFKFCLHVLRIFIFNRSTNIFCFLNCDPFSRQRFVLHPTSKKFMMLCEMSITTERNDLQALLNQNVIQYSTKTFYLMFNLLQLKKARWRYAMEKMLLCQCFCACCIKNEYISVNKW